MSHLASTIMLQNFTYFCVIFHVFCKSCRTLKEITLPWAAQMSCALINNKNWHRRCLIILILNKNVTSGLYNDVAKFTYFCVIFYVFCKSCRSLKVITLPWAAQMSCHLINNNARLGCCCTLNLKRICIIWPLQWRCKMYICLCNFSRFL